MRRLLQSFDFRRNSYERPNQNWICGNAGLGKSCRIGPDRRGRCRATFECTPRQDGDRWVCTRAPTAGGQCTDGPKADGTCCLAISKCAPLRSLRSKRRAVVAWASALAIGILAIVVEGSGAARILSPGPVTLQHSQVETCGGCHEDFDKGARSWVHAAIEPGDGLAESELCLGCHGWDNHAFTPHSIDPKILTTLAAARPETASAVASSEMPTSLKLARFLFDAPSKAADTFACGTCHKEHRGGDANLSLMGDGECQSCHTATFDSFSKGHPEFGEYPYVRRTRINFDHTSHIERHFVKEGAEKAPQSCLDCHLPSDSGEQMLVQGFEETCAACHLSQIEGEGLSGAKGIVFLTVPGLDVESLQAGGVTIGEWPEFSEEPITPFAKILLMHKEGLEADLERFGSLDLLDLTKASAEDLEAVGNVAWALKSLIHDILFDGMAPMGEMITETMGQEVGQAQLSDLLGAVPLDVVRTAQEAWFPDLLREIAIGREGLAAMAPPESTDVEVIEPDEAAEVPDDTAAEADDGEILSDDDEEILADDDGEILSDDEEEILSDDEGEILSDDEEEILADDEGEILSDDEDILADEDDGILSDDESDLDDDEIATGDLTDGTAESDSGALARDLSELDVEAWARLGGWYRLDYALFFRPTGHSDAFMQTWLDLSGRAMETSTASVGGALFEALSHKNAPGRCAKCHSIDQTETGGSLVNWAPRTEDTDFRHATFFSHTTHFSMLDQEGCQTCHKIDPAAKYAASFEQRDPHVFASNFQPLEKAICADCHVKSEAGEACLDCHRYHIGPFPGPVVETLMYSKDAMAAKAGEPSQPAVTE